MCTQGAYYPTYLFVGFSALVILGDLFLGHDMSTNKYKYPILINLPIYMNFPLLILFISIVVFILGNHNPSWFIDIFNNYLYVDILSIKESITLLDKISLVAITSLYIGVMGTVPGHELTHRKRNKFDMSMGNWLLAFSWDCAFAIEHVYGHHKNVGLASDPATARRGENIYLFIIKASIKEHIDAWKIELNHLKRRGKSSFGINNRMLIGYLKSLIITFIFYFIGGFIGMLFYLLCSIIAKSLLEVINYTEHYGLVREPDKPVCPHHSWNSNNIMSSILLYNVTRHSAHHEKSNLKFWELEPYPEAPMMPYGYLSMLYLAIFFPSIYHRIMAKRLIHWDKNYATEEEKNIAINQNKISGVPLLIKEYE